MLPAGWGIPAGLVAGVLVAQGLFFYGWAIWPLFSGLLLYFIFARKAWLAAAMMGLGWATLSLNINLADRLDHSPSGGIQMVEGWIEDLPQVRQEVTRFRLRPVANGGSVHLPRSLLTYWYRDAPTLLPGEFWRLELQLKPPWGRINFAGGDREQWLFAQKIGGLATVQSGERLRAAEPAFINWNALRQRVRQHLTEAVSDADSRAIVAALAIADRGSLSKEQRNVLSQTGTAHLLAISGLHIGLAAWCGLWFARLLVLAVPLRWTLGMAYPATLLASLALAYLYAALAGYGTSTIRALLMLAVGVLALLSRRTIHPGRAWLVALALILLFDPLAVLSAGFWLSFAAVGVLLLLFGSRNGRNPAWWRQMLQAQAGIMLVLLPLSAWWFQSASVCGLAANLLAIPFVSVVVVPLILLGLILLPVSSALAGPVFSVAGGAAACLLEALALLVKLPLASLSLRQPSSWVLVPATLGALMLLLPRGMRQRWLGLLLMLPLCAADRPPDARQVHMDVLDVGQGTAVLVSSNRHLLLYDSGPGDGEDFDLVDSVIRPAVLRSGHPSPDRVLISHADLDHAGGLRSVRALYPDAVVHASLPAPLPGIEPCDDSLSWRRDGLTFQVVHPSPYLPYLGNDSSCVIRISSDRAAILLPGDIASAAEQHLLLGQLKNVDILVVPHHGSKSSSTAEFLQAVRPRVAIATAGLGNRFGFPRPEVLQRYAAAGIPLWSTDACGAIRLQVSADGDIHARSARRSRPAPWRWPAKATCP